MTHATPRPANYRITRRMAARHRAHATAPHLGCVLCMVQGTAGR